MFLKTTLAGVELKNPTVLASGILGVDYFSLKKAEEHGAGAVTTKSLGLREWPGHKNPTVVEWKHGIINAVGLSTPGIENLAREWNEFKKLKVPLIVSIYGSTVAEFVEIAEFVASKKPAVIELNISCPNLEKHGQIFGCNPKLSAEVVSSVKNVSGKIPVMPKLTPNTHLLTEVALACEEAGADAVCAINTVSGMLINIDAKKPVLSFKKGGLSGPAIKPIAVKCVFELFEAVEIPILGVGGILNGKDAIEFIQAGATAVGIGSAIHYRGLNVFKRICCEMKTWMKENGFSKISKLRGVAHE